MKEHSHSKAYHVISGISGLIVELKVSRKLNLHNLDIKRWIITKVIAQH